MNATSKKTISFDTSLWKMNKRTRKSKSGTKSSKEPSDQPQQKFDSVFTQQLAQLQNNNMVHTDNGNPNKSTHAENQTHNNINEPVYGNLKNGSKPTYKMLYKPATQNANANSVSNQSMRTTRHSRLGLHPNKTLAKVCIAGKKSRRKIKKYIKELSGEPLTEIKNYLHNNSLIRCGSSAPPDILKEIYKNTKLTGKVTNTNGDVLLHNFFSQPDKESEFEAL